MYSLQHKTRANLSPSGKGRVYFTCHPKDFDLYFAMFVDDILAAANCVVYYDADYASPCTQEAMQVDLGTMQMFVIPITNRFLMERNRASEQELQFARKHHIPILPIVVEEIDYAEYNFAFGDIQFLNRNKQDGTEIPYEQKLKQYCEFILGTDETAKKLRAAFDAYIFLSYRKKDRKYAQELMRLVHKNEFCRDIAIWYDEFLTPGEGFNDAIQAMLEKSSLFTLVVTPNVVEEENYILTTEYPAAKHAGKTVLPVEMVPTSREALNEKYDNLPNVVHGENEVELSDSLKMSLREVAIKENDNDPVHLFFIGLAYLGGIDVEVDHERAVDLITRAAVAGVPEAAAKLAFMYLNGEGVLRNFQEYIKWQTAYSDILKKEYEKTPTEDLFWKWYQTRLDLGNLYANINEHKQATSVYKEILECCKTNKTEKGRLELSKLYYKTMYEGGYDSSKFLQGILPEAMAYQESLLKETNNNEVRVHLAYSYLMRASGYDTYEERLPYYENALSFVVQAEGETGSLDARIALAFVYLLLGMQQGDVDSQGAIEKLDKAIQILETLVKEAHSLEAQNRLLLVYVWKRRQTGKFSEEYCYINDRMLALQEEIAACSHLPGDSRCMQMLFGEYYIRLNDLHEAGKYIEAEPFFRKMFRTAKGMAEQDELHDREIVFCNDIYAVVEWMCQYNNEAYKALFDEMYEWTIQAQIRVLENYGSLYFHEANKKGLQEGDLRYKEIKEKSTKYKNRLESYQNIGDRIGGGEGRLNFNIGLFYYLVGIVDAWLGDYESTKKYCLLAIEKLRLVPKANWTGQVWKYLGYAYNNLAFALWVQDYKVECEAYRLIAKECAEKAETTE